MTDHEGGSTAARPSLEVRIAQRITSDGSVIISPRMAKWLDKQSGMTADRRSLLRGTDEEAYEVLYALHLSAIRADCGTNTAAAQRTPAESQVWFSTSEAAKTLGVTPRCVRNWCHTGQLHASLSGSRWLIHRASLDLKTA